MHQFDGDSGPGLTACQANARHCDRPEQNVAADGSHVVQATWQHVNIYDYNGNAVSSVTLSQFIASAGLNPLNAAAGRPYEPHVVFDEHIGRWIVTATGLYDCLMVSASADPSGAWKGMYLANNGNDPGMHLGYDKNGVYVSEFDTAGHDSNTANYSYAFFAIPSAEMQWTGTFAPAHLNRKTNTPLDGQPVIDHDTAKATSAPAFFMAKTCLSGSCQNSTSFSFQWLVNSVTWSGTTASYSADQLIKTGIGSTQNQWLYNTPLAAAQAGSATTLRVIEDHRVINAVQSGSHVYGALGSGPCTTNCAAQGADANDLLIWADLDCTNPTACTVAATSKVADANLHLAYPTIGVDSAGNIGLVAAASSSATELSLIAYSHKATDAPSSTSGPTTIIAGTHPYTCAGASVTVGNAVGIATVRDPLDGTKLWTTHEYGGSATACVWSTRILEYKLQ
ncbi:MAG: hypothetical protein JWO36_4550 [Myxococcales bacterium]|nr:hypothetical protein [Myxococcales bacterium]